MPLISVLLPVYNADKYLKECIESILDQTCSDFELLIYNDGSTDRSDEVVRSFNDDRIQYYPLSENNGYLNLLNRGLKEAKGRYIARMDADDIALSMRFEEQVSFLENNAQVGICGSWVEFIGNGSGVEKRPVTYEEVQYALFFGCPLTHPAVMMRTSMIRQHELAYQKEFYYAEDHDFFATAARFFPVVNIPKVLLQYRLHPEQIGSAKWMEQYHKKCLIQLKLISAVIENTVEKENRWLLDFLTEQSTPGKHWERELIKIEKKLVESNNETGVYSKPIFKKAIEVLFPQKKEKNIKNYYYRKYYTGNQQSVSLLIEFLKEQYNPFRYMGVKHTFYFIVKCITGYKRQPVS